MLAFLTTDEERGFRIGGHRSGLRRIVGRLDLDAVGMQRPLAKPFGRAEPLLGELRGLGFAQGVDSHGALADFDLSAVLTEHVFQEPGDELRHEPSPTDKGSLIPAKALVIAL